MYDCFQFCCSCCVILSLRHILSSRRTVKSVFRSIFNMDILKLFPKVVCLFYTLLSLWMKVLFALHPVKHLTCFKNLFCQSGEFKIITLWFLFSSVFIWLLLRLNIHLHIYLTFLVSLLLISHWAPFFPHPFQGLPALPRMVLNLRSSCFSLASAGITGMWHHAQLLFLSLF